jgi:hypothetical protein
MSAVFEQGIPMPRAARRVLMIAATAFPFSTQAAEQTGLRPDDHGPAGVMAEHMHEAGEFMFAYRYMFSRSGSTMLNGTDEVLDPELVAAGFSAVPTEMTMHMHMFDFMYAPRDWLTLMVMPQLVRMEMNMREVEGAPPPPPGGGHGGHGAHAHGTSGLGDTGLYALIRLLWSQTHHVHAGIGFSAPTGSVDQKDAEGVFTHYMMQLGSGTWDFLPSLTYTGQIDTWAWGAQASGIIRLEEKNESGFRFGDALQLTAWGSRRLSDWLSASIRVSYFTQGTVKGHYNGAHNHASPPDLQPNYGGRFVDLGVGLNAAIQRGTFAGYRLGIEWQEPVYQDVNGFQQKRDGALYATWSRAF